jgi:hypothetical protein
MIFIHQSAAAMASSSKVFFFLIDKVLDEVLSDSESNFLDSVHYSSGIDDLPVGEAIAMERAG